MGDQTRRIGVLYVVAVLVLASLAGGAYTGSVLSDTAQGEASIEAASDFTVDVGDAVINPTAIENDSDGDFTVDVTLSNPGSVTESRFELRVSGYERRHLDPTIVECDAGGGGTCTLVFGEDDLLEIVDSETGTYDITLSGWWDHGRDFVAHGTVDIVLEDHTVQFETVVPTTGGSTGTTTTAGNTATTTAGNTGTTSCAGNTGDCSGSTAIVVPSSPPVAASARNSG